MNFRIPKRRTRSGLTRIGHSTVGSGGSLDFGLADSLRMGEKTISKISKRRQCVKVCKKLTCLKSLLCDPCKSKVVSGEMFLFTQKNSVSMVV